MYDGPRNWKWIVPALGIGVVLMAQMMINSVVSRSPWMAYCIYGTVPVMLILGAQSVAMFWAYYSSIYTRQFVDRRNAQSTTADTRLFEMAKQMHPETVRLLLLQRKVVWQIKATPLSELVDWVLDADPRVHVGFVEHVLRGSNPYALMPKRDFSDKAYTFDPDRLVTDYEQYDFFATVLQRRGMLTQGFGNQPGQWIEPWNPELAGRQFGIVDLFEEDVAEVQKDKSTEDGVRQKAVTVQPKEVKETPLTDEDMQNIKELQKAHEQLSVKEYMAKFGKTTQSSQS